MKLNTYAAVQRVKSGGIPQIWHQFGSHLSQVSVCGKGIVDAYDTRDKKQVESAFVRAHDNLIAAQNVLLNAMLEYDNAKKWDELNRAVAQFSAATAMEELQVFALHPFNSSLLSLSYNWGYMKDHGTRGFYEMTNRYLDHLRINLSLAQNAFDNDGFTEGNAPFWLVALEIQCNEAPNHCSVCKVTIACVLAMAEIMVEQCQLQPA